MMKYKVIVLEFLCGCFLFASAQVSIHGIPTIHRDSAIPGELVGHTNHPENLPLTKSDRGRNLGDLLGVPSTHLLENGNLNNLDRTKFGVVSGRSVLLTRGGIPWRRQGGGRQGRGRGRKGRGRGGRGRGGRGRGGRRRRTTTTATTTTTTTTTTPSPKKSGGGGITIIRTSRPNPLAALGNAFRSALNVGSLFQSGLLRGKR